MKSPASRLLSQPNRRLISNLSQQIIYPENHVPPTQSPPPSELLRFALTGSSEPTGFNERLSGLLQSERTSRNPPPALWSSLKRYLPLKDGELVQALEQGIDDQSTDKSYLRSVIEGHVKDAEQGMHLQTQDCALLDTILFWSQKHHSLAELLLAVDDIMARLHRLRVPVSPHFYEIGMHYAISTLSAPALRRFLRGHRSVGSPRLSLRASSRLLKTCLKALYSALLENPKYDPKPMLAAITGEGKFCSPSWPKFHDIVGLTGASEEQDVIRLYLSCLVRLGSKKTLYSVWGLALEALKALPKDDHDRCLPLYDVVLELIQSSRYQTALKFLQDISQCCENTLPNIGTFRRLPALHDPIVGTAVHRLVWGSYDHALLDRAFRHIERRLGIYWNSNAQRHFSKGHDAFWDMSRGRGLFTINGNCAGFENIYPLFEEIKTYGCSTSPTDLGRIVDLLNTHDGYAYQLHPLTPIQPLFMKENRPRVLIRWRPQHSPIEFSGSRPPISHDPSRPWNPSALGLIRARFIANGVPQPGLQALHLMQLGTLEVQYQHEIWEPTPFIVAWDRCDARMVCFYVGKSTGVINPGPTDPNYAFHAMADVVPHLPRRKHPSVQHSGQRRAPWIRPGSCYLDVDPSPDLAF